MHKWSLIVLSGFALLACTTSKTMSGKGAVHPKVIQDSTEYELLVIDQAFDQWYTVNYSPVLDRTNEFYSSSNKFAVVKWNYYFTAGKYRRIIDSYLDYSPSIDYGLELNRKLFWYFKYVEEKYRVNLLK